MISLLAVVLGAVIAPDGTLALGPVGDARDLLRDLTDRALLEDLTAAWQTVQHVREWALDLCVRVESELGAGQRGEAVAEWQSSRYLGAGLAVLCTLRDRGWPPSQRALDTMLVLYQLHEFRLLDRILPGCQWHLLKSEGVMPPAVRDLLKDLIDKDSAPAEPAPDSAGSGPPGRRAKDSRADSTVHAAPTAGAAAGDSADG